MPGRVESSKEHVLGRLPAYNDSERIGGALGHAVVMLADGSRVPALEVLGDRPVHRTCSPQGSRTTLCLVPAAKRGQLGSAEP